MIALIWPVIRFLAPILLIIAAFGATWMHGYSKAEEALVLYRQSVQIESAHVKRDAEQHNEQIQQALTASAQIITETYETNTKFNTALADSNTRLLADRLRRDRAGRNRCTVPDNSGATGSSNAADTGSGSFLESSGTGLVAESARADAVTETARACQNYVTSLQRTFDENTLEPTKH